MSIKCAVWICFYHAGVKLFFFDLFCAAVLYALGYKESILCYTAFFVPGIFKVLRVAMLT